MMSRLVVALVVIALMAATMGATAAQAQQTNASATAGGASAQASTQQQQQLVGQPYCGPWQQAWYVSQGGWWYSWWFRWCYNPSLPPGQQFYIDWASWDWYGPAYSPYSPGWQYNSPPGYPPYPTSDSLVSGLTPNPAFNALLPTLRQMTTAPIILPASLPPEIKSVGIEEPASEADPYVTEGDRYSILLLYEDTAPNQVIKPYVHYMTAGRIIAWPASAPPPDPTNGLGTPQQLGDVTLPNGAVASLERLDPPQGANYGPFTVGTLEVGGYGYTVMIENDSLEGAATRQILSTMVRVPDST